MATEGFPRTRGDGPAHLAQTDRRGRIGGFPRTRGDGPVQHGLGQDV